MHVLSTKKIPILGLLWIGLAAVPLISSTCSKPGVQASMSLEEALLGDWEGVATEIILHTEGRTERTRTITVSEGEWESRMNRTPPRMTYFADHRYRSMYVSLIDAEGRQVEDTVLQEGTWTLNGDVLFIKEPRLSVPESEFKVVLRGNQLELRSTMDIDGDGDVDDKYWMMQRRLR